MPLRFHLLVLLLVGIVPMSLFAGALLVVLSRQQQEELRESMLDTTRAITLAVDREVESTIKRLELLGGAPSLRRDTLEEFHADASALVSRSDDWVNVRVFDRADEPLLDIRVPFGTKLTSPEEVQYRSRVVQTGRPAISDVFVNPILNQPVVHVAVPVFRNGQLEFVLAASLNLSGFDRILSDQAVRKDGIASILDKRNRFVARSRDAARYVGRYPNPELLAVVSREAEGSSESPMPVFDGPDVYSSWTRCRLTGWTVTFGVPSAPAEAALGRSLLMLAGAGGSVLLAAVLVAFLLGRRVTGAMTDATASAAALATRRPVVPLRSMVSEIDALGTALERANEVLERESLERRQAESERNALLEREQQARQDAEAANRAKDEFLAMLGHELRNPLAPILTAVELAKQRGNVARPKELQIIERQAQHLVQLVDDLLDVSRIARSKIALKREPVELCEVVSRAVEMAAPLLEAKQHVLSLDVPKRGLRLDADGTRLAQVFANLLTNAAKFTPPHGHVSLTAHRSADEVIVTVRDDGVGIAPELLPRIFDLFTQGPVDMDRSHGGLGLGLSLVRSFVELHGGVVTAHSAGGDRGSEFVVTLPAALAAVASPRLVRAESRLEATLRARVLIVDDNADAVELLADLIGSEGHEVRTAMDGPEALRVAEAFRPEVAIVDIGLPVMDGYELAQRLLQGAAPAPHLIAVTGYGQEHDRERSRTAGFSQHMVKPVDPDELLRAVATGSASTAGTPPARRDQLN